MIIKEIIIVKLFETDININNCMRSKSTHTY